MSIDDLATIATPLLTLGLLAVTFVLTYATVTLARETRRMREIQEAPRISVRVEPSNDGSELLLLVLRNEGQGVAENVQFIKIEGDPTYYTETVSSPKDWKGPTKLPFFERGVAQWESGQTFKFILGYVDENAYRRAAPQPWIFHVEYNTQSGKKICQKIEWDFSLQGGSPLEGARL